MRTIAGIGIGGMMGLACGLAGNTLCCLPLGYPGRVIAAGLGFDTSSAGCGAAGYNSPEASLFCSGGLGTALGLLVTVPRSARRGAVPNLPRLCPYCQADLASYHGHDCPNCGKRIDWFRPPGNAG